MQRALDESVALASNVPAAHGCLASQYGWPLAVWNLPEGQGSQLAALISCENCITAHGAHVRSTVAFGADATRSPATHVECFVHDACAASGWKVSLGHVSHAVAFVVAEIVPGVHGEHVRSAIALGGDATNSPFVQAVCGRQKPLPAAGWNVRSGHGLHAAAFSSSENCPAKQGVQALPSIKVPGLHVPQYPPDAPPQPLRCAPFGHAMLLHSTHCTLPGSFWKKPVAHCLHPGFPSSSW